MSTSFDRIMRRCSRFGLALPVVVGVWLSLGGAPALAAGEAHRQIGEFGSFTSPNGIAIDETTGDVYVADIATDTVYEFDEAGIPLDFFALTSNELTGTATPSGSFSFPTSAYGTPAAIAVDNSKDLSDPSRGDIYVMDAGHGVIDKFNASGEYLNEITGFTPATGSPQESELFGLGVDANGDVRVDSRRKGSASKGVITIEEFDDSATNNLIARQSNEGSEEIGTSGVPHDPPQEADGFAVGPTGDDYLLYRECSCVVKVGQQLAGLGKVDQPGAGDVAVVADPATGHVYVDNQASVAEWDTGTMNGSLRELEPDSTGELVGKRFGSLSGSTNQGGIAVDGKSGKIYVANPGAGKVDVFASEAPTVTATAATGIGRQAATLHGTVDPRGETIASCKFEYGLANELGQGEYEHEVACAPEASAIGGGTSPVAVSAAIAEGLEPGLLYRFRLVTKNVAGVTGESSGLLATAGVGFQVNKFDVKFLNEDGSPDTQAGSHPYKMVNDIEFASHFVQAESNADSPYVREPNGTLKDLRLDFPPGMVGDPNATSKKCTAVELVNGGSGEAACPAESFVGEWALNFSSHLYYGEAAYKLERIYNMVAPYGVPVQLGVLYELPGLFIDNGLLAGGDYPIQATIENAPTSAPVVLSSVTIFGVVGKGATRKAFLTLPTGCHGPLESKVELDSYQNPGVWVEKEEVTRNSTGAPVGLTGCSKLRFPPTISVKPDTTDASTPSGLTVGVHLPQTAAFNPEGLAESSLRDTKVTLPQGVAINPSGGDGLEACTSDPGALSQGQEEAGVFGTPGDQIGFRGAKELNKEYEPEVKWDTFSSQLANPLMPSQNFCPDGSKIGTVKIKTPLLEHELEGAVYLAQQNANPFGSLVAMYMVAEDPFSGSLIKLAGEVSLSENGQIVTTFNNTPDLPFENLELHFFGGERAPLTTPARCGAYTTEAVFTPWDGNGPVHSTSSFEINHGPHGTPCPGANLPFNPTLNAGTVSNNAGNYSALSTTIERQDGEQNMQSVSLHMPLGLSGVLSGVKLCSEAQANEGTCGPESLIGETTVAAGVGSDPVSVTGGKVYLTEKYDGAPFGLSIVNPVKAGPFDLEHDTTKPATNMPACDCLVVRAKIEVDPFTAALTVTTDPSGPHVIPHLIDGVPVQIQKVSVLIDREHFTFNPTNCEPLKIEGNMTGDEGASAPVGASFEDANCANLAFKPGFEVSTSGKTSRKNGASLHVKLTYPNAPLGTQANIKSVHVELPKALPSRLSTLNHACVDSVFNQNPADCPSESRVGFAKAVTPVLPVPLEGPAYFVSYGGQKFPELIVVLQGYGVTVDLRGETFISEAGITSSTFKSVPDVPVGSFELTLPEGAYSALAANTSLCAANLTMPATFDAQNGDGLKESVPVEVQGCPYSLVVMGHSVHKRTLTLKVSVPTAGKLVASGKGVSSASGSAKGRQTLTLTLNERQAGKLRTKVALRFTPSSAAGKQRGKQAQILRKSLTVTFP